VFMITLGLDRLAACSRISYERPTRRMTLRCRGGVPA
jgi:hypothetical protein